MGRRGGERCGKEEQKKKEQRENITKEKRKVTVNATGSYKGRMIMYDVLVIGAGPGGQHSC